MKEDNKDLLSWPISTSAIFVLIRSAIVFVACAQ